MRHRCDCEEDLKGDFCAKVALGPGGELCIITVCHHCLQPWELPPLFSLYRVFFLHLAWKGWLMHKGHWQNILFNIFLLPSGSWRMPKVQDMCLLPLIFGLCIHFIHVPEGRGKIGHRVVAWVNEYLSHGLRAKPEPCYGKVNVLLDNFLLSLLNSSEDCF